MFSQEGNKSSVDAEVMLLQPGYLGVVAQAMHVRFLPAFLWYDWFKKW